MAWNQDQLKAVAVGVKLSRVLVELNSTDFSLKVLDQSNVSSTTKQY